MIFRFAEPLPDDTYRLDISGVGSSALRNTQGQTLGDSTDDNVENGKDYSLQFELDLGAQVLGVVPQPVIRTSNGVLAQATSQIEVYFNDDNLDPATAANRDFYQLAASYNVPFHHLPVTADTKAQVEARQLATARHPGERAAGPRPV